MFLPDGREAPEWFPHGRESWLRLEAETPIFAKTFIDLAACPVGNPDCEWTIWDGMPHEDPPEWGFHSTGCEGSWHCGPCDTRHAIAELHREMAQIAAWQRQDDDDFSGPLFEPDDHDAWGLR